VACLAIFAMVAPSAWGQSTSSGTVTVTVVDQSGGVVAAAQLQLQDLSTNDIRNGVTQDKGNLSFVNLPIGTYKLTVSKTGFSSQIYDSVIVQAAQVTDIAVTLKVAAAAGEKIEVVESATPLIDVTSNAISTTIDMKQIEDLPIGGRSVAGLAQLVPGYNGTWNGLPAISQSNNIDGVIASTSRMKFGGDTQPQVQARIEDIQEMTVQTDQLDANQGFGQSAMEVNFVTRRGSNSFHGRAYEDFQNSYLNANSWYNDATDTKKGHAELNQFGASLGGPILKNKLFFFGTFAELKQPSTSFPTATVLDSAAQQGNFTYVDSNGANQTVNVYQIAQAYDPSLPGTANTTILNGSNGLIDQVNSVLSKGTLIPVNGEPSLETLRWTVPRGVTNYYPTVRVDYNLSQSFRLNFAWNATLQPARLNYLGAFPGFPTANFQNNDQTGSLGFDWTMKPTLVNSFRGGMLYNRSIYTNSPGYSNGPSVDFAIGDSPAQFALGTGQYYPLFNLSDTTTWQHGAHNVTFGASWYREFDHYYNPSGGIYGVSLGLDSADPAYNAFDVNNPMIPNATDGNIGDLQDLYATLTGRISFVGTGGYAGNPVDLQTGQYSSTPGFSYNLHELQKAWGLFFQDSYRVKPNLTVNYSLRWDFTGDDHDLTGAYHGITSVADVWGPSGVGNLFMPGVLNGNPIGGHLTASEHQYNPWNVSPQPQVGIAWSPQFSEGFLGKLTGNGNMVVRAGIGKRNFIEPYQYFWDDAADRGNFFLQHVSLDPSGNPNGQVGLYQSGSLSLDPSMLSYSTAPFGTGALAFNPVPVTYEKSVTEAEFALQSGAPPMYGIDPHAKQPYVTEWNFGIQRQIGRGNAIEISYHGNRAVHQWINLNLNEVNIFENGFLDQFKQAQTNLALNNAAANASAYPSYKGTFADNPAVLGEGALPIFDAAFASESGAIPTDYKYRTFITDLQQGQAADIANRLTRTSGGQGGADFYCNLVGTNFAPCGTVKGSTGPGPYPSNFFQVNPFYTGSSANVLESAGYSTYNGLQIDFRQKQWHGMQFDANYTWSKNLGVSTPNDWTGAYNQITLRNPDLSYAPTLYDYRHVVHVSGTYDLPFGKGRMLLNRGGMLDRVVGGWTLGTIFSFSTGRPFTLGGGYSTFNNVTSGGVVLNGISVSQLQDAVGVQEITGANFQAFQTANCPSSKDCAPTFVDTISPGLLSSYAGGLAGRSTTAALAYPNMSPGTLITPIYLYGPHYWTDNISVTKSVPIRENLRFSLQGEFLNAFNHPTFGTPSSSVTSSSFGTTGAPGGARQIELRANLEF